MQEGLFERIPKPEPKRLSKRASAFDQALPQPLSHRPQEDEAEDNWVPTATNGSIPIIAVVLVGWGLSEKWMRTLPCPNDGEFGPMRYGGNPDAKYWGNYRRDIQPRKGRRHLDWGDTVEPG